MIGFKIWINNAGDAFPLSTLILTKLVSSYLRQREIQTRDTGA